jgi:hypothetical protein
MSDWLAAAIAQDKAENRRNLEAFVQQQRETRTIRRQLEYRNAAALLQREIPFGERPGAIQATINMLLQAGGLPPERRRVCNVPWETPDEMFAKVLQSAVLSLRQKQEDLERDRRHAAQTYSVRSMQGAGIEADLARREQDLAAEVALVQRLVAL